MLSAPMRAACSASSAIRIRLLIASPPSMTSPAHRNSTIAKPITKTVAEPLLVATPRHRVLR